ncbi:MAG: hypothetical protein M3548_15820 [Actinomycetota bacterium]|nr:hypothetical protein [Actinomycetota bacterium]
MPEFTIAVLAALLGAFVSWYWTVKWHRMSCAAKRHQANVAHDGQPVREVVTVVAGTENRQHRTWCVTVNDVPAAGTGESVRR